MGGSAGARGEEGVTAARAGARAPTPRQPRLAREDPAGAVDPAVPNPSGRCGFEPRPAVPLGQAAGSAPGRLVSGSAARVVGPGTRSRGRRGGLAGAARGERAAAASFALLHARCEVTFARPVAPRRTCHSTPGSVGGFGIPRAGTPGSAPSPLVFPGLKHGRVSWRLGKLWAASGCRSKLLMKRAVAAECGRISPG